MPERVTKECKKHGLTEYVLEGRGYYRCVKCRAYQVTKRRDRVKVKAIEYKGGKCERCSYKKCIPALEFHHVESEHKDFSLSGDGHTRSWEKIKVELDKCILVCANCHREIHDAGKMEAKHKQYEIESSLKKETLIRHGTKVGYSYHKCRCDLCREYNTKKCKEYKDKKKLMER